MVIVTYRDPSKRANDFRPFRRNEQPVGVAVHGRTELVTPDEARALIADLEAALAQYEKEGK